MCVLEFYLLYYILQAGKNYLKNFKKCVKTVYKFHQTLYNIIVNKIKERVNYDYYRKD